MLLRFHEKKMKFPELLLASNNIILIEDYGSAPSVGLHLANALIHEMNSTGDVVAIEDNMETIFNKLNPSSLSNLVFIPSLTPLLIFHSVQKVLKLICK